MRRAASTLACLGKRVSGSQIEGLGLGLGLDVCVEYLRFDVLLGTNRLCVTVESMRLRGPVRCAGLRVELVKGTEYLKIGLEIWSL